MTTAIFFDTYSGISGDMTLGALLHAGMPLEYLQRELAKLGLSNYQLELKPAKQHGITGLKLDVVLGTPGQQEHRGFTAIRQIIAESKLPERVKERATRIFFALAEAEGQIHGIPTEEVHFHEVGAVDAIVDIVGSCIGFEYFEIEEFYCGQLPLGSGLVKAAHGLMPVPAPATLQLLANAGAIAAPQVRLGDGSEYPARSEMVTPTGAAIVATLCQFQRPAMQLEKTGYGFGSKEFAWPNALRIWIGQTNPQATLHQPHQHTHDHSLEQHKHEHEHTHKHEQPQPERIFATDEISVLETNLDDMSPEGLGYLMEKLMAAEALDVYFTPIQMKKNRPAVMLGVLARPADESKLVEIILRETSAFGLRVRRSLRYKVERAFKQVETADGQAQVKLKIVSGEVIETVPEYESVAAIARRTGKPWREVYDEVKKSGVGESEPKTKNQE